MADDFVSVAPSGDFLAQFRAKGKAMGHDLSAVSDDELLQRILAKRPELKDRLILPSQTKPQTTADADKALATFTHDNAVRANPFSQEILQDPTVKDKEAGSRTALGMRVLGGVGGGLMGGLRGSAIGSGVGEVLGEGYERRVGLRPDATNLSTVAGQTAVGALPFNKIAPGMGPFRQGAVQGGAASGLGEAARIITDEGRMPTFGDVAKPVLYGAGLGGALSKFGPAIVARVAKMFGISLEEAASKLAQETGGAGPEPPPIPQAPPQFQYPDAPGVLSTQPPPIPPGFRSEAVVGDMRAKTRGMRDYQAATEQALRTDPSSGQMSFPGFQSRPPGGPELDPNVVQQALSGSPEGQALFRFMQEGSAGKPYWKQPGVSGPPKVRPRPMAPPPEPAPVAAAEPPMPTPQPAAPEVPATPAPFRPGTPETVGPPPAPAGDVAALDAQIEALRVKPGEPHDPARVKMLFGLMDQRDKLQRGAASLGSVGDVAALGVGALGGAAYDPEHPYQGALAGAAMAYAAKHSASALLSRAGAKGGAAAEKDLVEGVTPTGQTFVRQEPVAIPKNERIQAGNIPLARLDNIGLSLGKMPAEVVPGLQGELNALGQEGALHVQRRGVMPVKMIEQLASRQKVRIDKPGQPGKAYNGEELLALAYADVGAQVKVDQVAATQGTPQWSEAKMAEALLQRQSVTQTLSGASAEAGRSMRTLQIIRNVMKIGDPELIQRAIRESGGEQRLRYIAAELSKLPDDPDIRKAALDRLLDEGGVRYLERTFQAALLSAPHVHALNSVSNAFNTAYKVGALPARAAVGEIQGALGGQQGSSWESVQPALVGLMDGVKQGAEAAAYVWKHGMTPGQAQGMGGLMEGLNSGRFDVPMPEFRTDTPGSLMNPVHKGYNVVLRALGAADQFFSVMNTQSARMGLAATIAHNEATAGKLTGAKFKSYIEKRVPEILLTKDTTLEEAAIKEGRQAVGQEDLGKIGNAFLALRELPGSGFVIPFIKTTMNFFRQGLELSPAAPLSGQWRESVLGTRSLNPADMHAPQDVVHASQQAEALGRTLFGSMALTAFYMGHKSGTFTLRGALPDDPKEKQRFLNEGRQPYAFEVMHEGKPYAIPFRVLGPLAIPLGMMADGFDTLEHVEKESDKLDMVRRMAVNVSENTAFGQFMDLAEAIKDPKKLFNTVTRIAAAMATPGYGLLTDVQKGLDQTMREKPDLPRLIDELGWQKGLVSGTAQQMPLIGGTVSDAFLGPGGPERQPLRGPMGEPMSRYTPEWVPPGARFAYHALTPVPIQEIKPKMGQIQPIGKDWTIGPKGREVTLTTSQEAALREAKGEATAKAIERLEKDPRYQALDDAKKQVLRDKLVREVRAAEARKIAAEAMKQRK